MLHNKAIDYKTTALVCAIALLISCNKIYAQSNVAIQAKLITIHPFNNYNADLSGRQIDPDGIFIFEPGVLASFELFTSPSISAYFSTGAFMNWNNQIAGLLNISIKPIIYRKFRHGLSINLGPSLFVRQVDSLLTQHDYFLYNWYSEQLQVRTLWLSGGIHYNYYINKKTDLNISLQSNQPESFSLSFGVRHWINKKGKRKGCNCPSYK